ncbi:MAG: hypothetical protein A2788_02510 [Candidatus Abawacabacteria bacterium RIFCSPHIGHO2_01_FULL_46_8]|uniref:thioredoxin-dependent peroxiredoxin n=1 Tax=Candidatus Abawacabacteria bacterium RIFCSPHIGHO2_01_FULL_46_8 TaxID=1817815 RepID=A0A1F4XM41_9BACT|nr:MAG: hypothetical protein A2788_02510 [Candidatus Abawacabacteria bacterium RIFCSPHIGHO2_01_FULL_46_8]
MPLAVNSPAPDFKAEDQNGTIHQLKDYHGKYLLLYFYPRDNTPGCTQEACAFRDYFAALKDKVKIVGVSKDSVKSHTGFVSKYELPFTLLSDPEQKLIKAYGVDGIIFSKRSSFLIGPDGKIVQIYRTVKPMEHAQEVLKDMETLQG